MEFIPAERKLVDTILQHEGLLGSTSTAVVEKVRCRRILLARKKIRCNRYMTRDRAVNEVAHLSRLDHAHVIRVIGTYVCGPELSILLYPVAEWNLATILDEDSKHDGSPWWFRGNMNEKILRQFTICLSNALAYIHSCMTKRMDIKPQNILVKRQYWGGHSWDLGCRVYIADFGIARSYTSLAAVETEGPTMFTRKYAAPEVVDCGKRGLSADIFSMGCVFLEIVVLIRHWVASDIWTALTRLETSSLAANVTLNDLKQLLARRGDSSYQANLDITRDFLDKLEDSISPNRLHKFRSVGGTELVESIKRMISFDPAVRPTAAELVKLWGMGDCCLQGAEDLAVEVSMADVDW